MQGQHPLGPVERCERAVHDRQGLVVARAGGEGDALLEQFLSLAVAVAQGEDTGQPGDRQT